MNMSAHYIAMKTRQRTERHVRFLKYKSDDLKWMNTEELVDYISWLDGQLLGAVGARFGYLDILDDMAREELESR